MSTGIKADCLFCHPSGSEESRFFGRLACPERDEILRFAQNDTKQRARNDSRRRVQGQNNTRVAKRPAKTNA